MIAVLPSEYFFSSEHNSGEYFFSSEHNSGWYFFQVNIFQVAFWSCDQDKRYPHWVAVITLKQGDIYFDA